MPDPVKQTSPTPNALSKADIECLLKDRSTTTKMNVVEKLIEQYAAEGKQALSADEVTIANDIFGLLLVRGESIVRAMLATNLSQVDTLSPALAQKMAKDTSAEVALPVLQYSNVLSDNDLMDIINSVVDTEKLQAIAKRHNISEKISDALIDTNLEPVVSTLVQNESARITEQSFKKIAKDFGGSFEVIESIFQRSSVPGSVVEKVISRLSVTMRQELEKKYGNLSDSQTMKKTLDQSLELTRMKLMGYDASDKELVQMLNQLDKDNKLPPFSALSMGNLHLFEVSISCLLGISLKNAQVLLQDSVGFKAAYQQAGLPVEFFDSVALAVRALRTIEQENMQKTGFKGKSSHTQIIERMRKLSSGQNVKEIDRFYLMIQYVAH
jgi:hypothetical protein